MDSSKIVVCSFHTADDYYRGHAAALRANLTRLGIAHELSEVEKLPGEEWPDICRKKIPFLAGVCDRHPDEKVFWIDVDCQLIELPQFVRDFSADIIGFQRGFSSPLGIGYGSRTRFWEPCFFGINSTVSARKFIEDARALEATAEVRATDDYFFEESWRASAHRMSFQLIPSICVSSRARPDAPDVPVFFHFGDSGHVAEYKGKVVQHRHMSASGVARPALKERVRRQALGGAKAVERRLPVTASRRLRRLADRTGATHALTGGGADALHAGADAVVLAGSPHRRRLVDQMMMAGQRGDADEMNQTFMRLSSAAIPTSAELLARQAAESFCRYASSDGERPWIPLAWWPRPFPGNFGDWLSPLIISSLTDHAVRYVSPTAKSGQPHLVGVGSIGRFVKSSSIVVGTGVSTMDVELEPTARYISVRGPLTAELLARSGGPSIESFGDPGVLLARVLPFEPTEPIEKNGRLALVRHFTHARAPIILPPDVDELNVLMSHPDSIRAFIEQSHQYDGVITTAMHVMIACHSYGIPCALVGFEGFESTVHGTGMKYRDYSLGAGLSTVHEPAMIPLDLRRAGLRSRLQVETVSNDKLDEIEGAVRSAVGYYVEHLSGRVTD